MSYGNVDLFGAASLDATPANRNSLYCCRRGDGLRTTGSYPTVDVDVECDLIEQRLKPQVVEAEMSSRV